MGAQPAGSARSSALSPFAVLRYDSAGRPGGTATSRLRAEEPARSEPWSPSVIAGPSCTHGHRAHGLCARRGRFATPVPGATHSAPHSTTRSRAGS